MDRYTFIDIALALKCHVLLNKHGQLVAKRRWRYTKIRLMVTYITYQGKSHFAVVLDSYMAKLIPAKELDLTNLINELDERNTAILRNIEREQFEKIERDPSIFR